MEFEVLHPTKIVTPFRNIYTEEGYDMYTDISHNDKEEADLICIVDYFSYFVIAISKQEIIEDSECTPAQLIKKYGLRTQNIIIEEVKSDYLYNCFENFDILKLGFQ